jgi:hypothetical protein
MGALSLSFPDASTFEWLSLADLKTPPVCDGAAYWNKLRGERSYPFRHEVRARDIAGLLPYVSIIRVVDGGTDFEHRIIGDVMVRAFDVPLQNRRMSDVAKEAPTYPAYCWPPFRRVIETGQPVAWRFCAGRGDTSVVISAGEIALLPLGRSPEGVDHMLGFGTHVTHIVR